MKLLFTADWHIKLGQKNVPRDWQLNRFRSMFSQLLTEEFDLLVIGGDIFDAMPKLEELELYFEFIKQVAPRRTVIYPGNHEALKKTTTFLTYLKTITEVASNGSATILDEITKIDNIDFIPYNRLKTFKPEDFSGNILCTHVRGEIPPHVHPEVDLDLFYRWDLVLAGDLHSHSNSQRNIVYPGSPVTTSFHRSETKTGYLLVDTGSLKWEFKELQVPQLIRKTVTSPDEMVKTEYHHTIYELEGDLASLKAKVNTELLDKKIVRKESKSTLSLHNLTLSQELELYLKEIMKLDSTRVKEVMTLFNDNIKETTME